MKKFEEWIAVVPTWVKSIVIIAITGTFCYKAIVTPFNLELDVSSFLALALALFSIAMSTLFYLKATETSNQFYDNTYKFTIDIAELLTRIESGFGERLKHLDEGYSNLSTQISKKSEITETEVKREEREIEKVLKERDGIINELLEKAKIDQTQKTQFINKLDEKNKELQDALAELSVLKDRLSREEERESNSVEELPRIERIERYINKVVIPRLGTIQSLKRLNAGLQARRFKMSLSKFNPIFLSDMAREGFFDSEKNVLTEEGRLMLNSIISNY